VDSSLFPEGQESDCGSDGFKLVNYGAPRPPQQEFLSKFQSQVNAKTAEQVEEDEDRPMHPLEKKWRATNFGQISPSPLEKKLNRSIACPHCGKLYKKWDRKALKIHLEVIGRKHQIQFPDSSLKKGYFPCEHCERVFDCDQTWEEHMKQNHPRVDLPRKRDNEEEADRRSETESSDNIFKCEVCEKIFYKKRSLNGHLQMSPNCRLNKKSSSSGNNSEEEES